MQTHSSWRDLAASMSFLFKCSWPVWGRGRGPRGRRDQLVAVFWVMLWRLDFGLQWRGDIHCVVGSTSFP